MNGLARLGLSVMNGARDQLFTRARLAGNQY